MKIVQIDTQYVETDAVNFRAVVQRLTGKDASTVWVGKSGGTTSSFTSSSCLISHHQKTAPLLQANNNGSGGGEVILVKKEEEDADDVDDDAFRGDGGDILSCMKFMNLSYKDLERLLSEFPLMEELGTPMPLY